MKATHWILIFLTAALIAFDIVAAVTSGLPTISQVIWSWIGNHPIIPFTAGVICGHLFWQGKK